MPLLAASAAETRGAAGEEGHKSPSPKEFSDPRGVRALAIVAALPPAPPRLGATHGLIATNLLPQAMPAAANAAAALHARLDAAKRRVQSDLAAGSRRPCLLYTSPSPRDRG